MKSKYQPIVWTAAAAAALVGVPGAFSFAVDAPAMASILTAMIVSLYKKAGYPVQGSHAMKIAAGIVGGVAGYKAGSELAVKLLHLIPGAGSLAAVLINSSLNGYFMYFLGDTLAQMIDKPNFDLNDAKYIAQRTLQIVLPFLTIDKVAPSDASTEASA